MTPGRCNQKQRRYWLLDARTIEEFTGGNVWFKKYSINETYQEWREIKALKCLWYCVVLRATCSGQQQHFFESSGCRMLAMVARG
ncbi:MAG: hypothetical protein IPO04_14800 [Cytophagaceae bacterium]|nr:hypothetical protein [Cytophagaceae bacterium]